jgi:hypothetical protein
MFIGRGSRGSRARIESAMHFCAKSLGMVRVWREGDDYKWVPVGKWAPENADLAKRLQTGDEDVLYIDRAAGGFIHRAVKDQLAADVEIRGA